MVNGAKRGVIDYAADAEEGEEGGEADGQRSKAGGVCAAISLGINT